MDAPTNNPQHGLIGGSAKCVLRGPELMHRHPVRVLVTSSAMRYRRSRCDTKNLWYQVRPHVAVAVVVVGVEEGRLDVCYCVDVTFALGDSSAPVRGR